MSFIAQSWLGTVLIGLAAASVPIILHFLFKSRYKTVPWAAMKFLKLSLEQTSRRIQFQELLLLLLRVLLMLLLMFAVLRPRWGGTNSGHEPLDAAFVLDSSISMDAMQKNGMTRFSDCKNQAMKLLEALPSQSSVQIFRAGKSAVALGPIAAANRDQARVVLQEATVTQESGDMLPALLLAADWLKHAPNGNKQLFVFSDLQASDWDKQASEIRNCLIELSRTAQLWIIHPEGKEPIRNATLELMQLQAAWPSVGERIPFTVRVRNTGKESLASLAVQLKIAGRDQESDSVVINNLLPHEVRSVTLTAKMEKPGNQLLTAWMENDELAGDNRIDSLIEVKQEIRLLILDSQLRETSPEKSSSYYLSHAIRPVVVQESTSLNLAVVSAREADASLLQHVPLVIMTGIRSAEDWPNKEFMGRLQSFVQSGGSLLIIPGATPTEDAWKQIPWLPVSVGRYQTMPAEKPFRFDLKSISPNGLLSSFTLAPMDRLEQTELYEHLELVPAQNAETHLNLASGKPAIVSGPVGSGLVMISSFSCDLMGGDFPLRPTFVPWIHTLIRHLMEHHSGRLNFRAGEFAQLRIPMSDARERFTLQVPNKTQMISLYSPTSRMDRYVLQTTETAFAGVYRALKNVKVDSTDPDDTQGAISFAVQPDPTELADFGSLAPSQLDERISIKLHHLTADSEMISHWKEGSSGREWTSSVLWMLLLFVLAESGLAWFCGRAW